jgi:hypothetical protein
MFSGFGIAMMSPSVYTNEVTFPLVGEWHSKVFTPTDNQLCLELDVATSSELQMSFDLITSDLNDQLHLQRKTVFQIVKNGQTRMKLLAELSIGFQPKSTSLAKLIVFLSANVVISKVSFQPSSCLIASW